jgi:hypothetical protein
VYREQQGNEEWVGWSFQATLREQFDYSRYPLGRHQIWLRMWHPDYERNVYLAPDLGAYTALDPAALPGVDPNLVLENWNIQQSFFSFRTHRYNTDFGTRGYVADQGQPELYYSIAAKRHLVSPLISGTIVPVVTLLLLFIVVLLMSKDSKRLEALDARPGVILVTCAAFFFVLLVAQDSLRNEVKASGLVYLESLYIITYFVLLVVTINSVLLVVRPNLRLFRNYDNTWISVFYWPTILLTMVIVTFLTFR